MSLILDALRKMEQERKSRRGAAGDLRPEVLRYRGERGERQSKPPYLLVTIGLVLLLIGVGAGVLLGGHGSDEASRKNDLLTAENAPAAAAPSAPPAAVVVAPTAPAPPVTEPAVKASVPISATASAAPDAAPLNRSAVPAAAPVSASAAPTGETDDAPVHVVLPAGKRGKRGTAAVNSPTAKALHPAPAKQSQPAADEVAQGGAGDISISGIAWQDERNLRRAVLNGNLVGEGAMVAGARVVEIKETKVRLSRNGRLFDVVLTSALPR